MPIYENICPECLTTIEVMCRIADRHVRIDCPDCETRMIQSIHPPALCGMIRDPSRRHLDEFTKNELASALKENDKYRLAEEKNTEAAIKSGEFI